MQQTVRTTITFPEDLYQELKIIAVRQKKTLSEVVTDLAKQSNADKNPMRLLGQLHQGVGKIHDNRDDLYTDHINRKMGISFLRGALKSRLKTVPSNEDFDRAVTDHIKKSYEKK